MIGFNGGLIGKSKVPLYGSLPAGVWTLNEQEVLKRRGLWFPWTPANITTELWLDASDNTTVFSDAGTTQATPGVSTVQQWNDKSGNGRNCTQSTSGSRPAYRFSGLNSLPTLEFTGDVLNGLSASPLTLSTRSLFMVFELGSDPVNGGIFTIAPTSGNDYEQTTAVAYTSSFTPNILEAIGSTNFSYLTTITGTRPAPLGIYSEIFSTTTGSLYQDGTLKSTDSSFTSFSASSGQGYLIGARFTGGISGNFTGRIAEIIYAGSSLAVADRQKVEGYLAHKWGTVSKLPSDHPYKFLAP